MEEPLIKELVMSFAKLGTSTGPRNCFAICKPKMNDWIQSTWVNGVPVAENIILYYPGVGCGVYLDKDHIVRLEKYPNTPWHKPRLLLRAKITNEVKPRLTWTNANIRRIIVYIDSFELNFEIEPIAEGLNLWPGGDGDILPSAESGKLRGGSDKRQLFEIPNGQFIYVIDMKKAIARLSCVDGKPVISIPDVPEVVEFLCNRAKAQRGIRAIDWALHNLSALQRNDTHGELIQDSIDELERLREKA